MKTPKPRKHSTKKAINSRSAWKFVGPAVLKELSKTPERRITGALLDAILVAAINPAAFAASIEQEATREVARMFSVGYALDPELTLRLLQVVRKRWNDKSPTVQIQKAMFTKCLSDEKGHPIQNPKDFDYCPSTAKNPLSMERAIQKIRQRHKETPPLSTTQSLSLAKQELRRMGFYVP